MAWTYEESTDGTNWTAVGAEGPTEGAETRRVFTAEGGSQADYTADAVNTEADNSSSLEALRAEQAEAAGLQDARHAGYAEVLANYEARTDTEPLRDRRARALAFDPEQQDFTRAADYDGQATEAESTYPADPDAETGTG